MSISNFAAAIYELHHSLGWMLHLQRELSQPGNSEKTAVIVTDIEAAWKEVHQRLTEAKAAACLPSHNVGTLDPAAWRHQVLCDMDAAVESAGGPFSDPLLKIDLNAAFAARQQCEKRHVEAKNLLDATKETATEATDTTGWLTVTQAADKAGVKTADISGACRGRLAYNGKTGPDRLISPASLDHWMKNHELKALRKGEKLTPAPAAAAERKSKSRGNLVWVCSKCRRRCTDDDKCSHCGGDTKLA